MQFNLILIFFFFHKFLILLSQYSDAWNHCCAEILNSLQRMEYLFHKQTLKCLVPAEKLFNLISETSTISNNDSNEVFVCTLKDIYIHIKILKRSK